MNRCTTLSMFVAAMMLLAAGLPATAAETANPLGKNLKGWLAKGPIEKSKWTVGTAGLDKDDAGKLAVLPLGDEPPALITPEGHGADVYTEAKFGDCTVELEVMVPKRSNSGIYLMGEYEVQVLDSFGRERVGPGDMGGIYGANAPRVNASGEPGTWQKYVIEFRAPRFDADGNKTANARFVKVTLNGDDCLTGFSFHLEDIPITRVIRPPVDDDGKSHLLRLGRLVVGFLVQALGQRVQGERHVVGDEFPVRGGNQMAPWLCVLGGGASVAFPDSSRSSRS